MHVLTHPLVPEEIARTMVQCIQEATGDDIREDLHRSGIRTRISTPTRIWDYINTGLLNKLETRDCVVTAKKRGLWELVIVYERSTQCIFTFMREERFRQLQRDQKKGGHTHYLGIFGESLNADLKTEFPQTSLFSDTVDECEDDEELRHKLKELLFDLGGEAEFVRHHVLVLFEASNFHLSSVRAVMVTPKLEIAQGSEEDWTKYITIAESVIVDQVEKPESPANSPARGLHLRDKARLHKEKKLKTKTKQPDSNTTEAK